MSILSDKTVQAKSDIKVGDRVHLEGKDGAWEITAIRLGHNNWLKYVARRVKKDGLLGSRVFERYGCDKMMVIRDDLPNR